MYSKDLLDTLPHGDIGIICMKGCEELGAKIDNYLKDFRKDRAERHKGESGFKNYSRDTYIIDVKFDRFQTGEGKATITQSVRGYDIFILCDVFNYGVTFRMYDTDIPMSPDDHYADLKRVISAIGGKAKRVTVIMPMLYEGRQHKRAGRESLDCADALQELCDRMGVDNIITFDAHDARVQNAVPLDGFENVRTSYQMIKALINTVPDISIDKNNLMIISPDEGGLSRCIYYATTLEVELGMFYKLRDYSVVVDGRNPIIAHQFLGDNVNGKDVIIVDDMISSGNSMLDVVKKLKLELQARRIFIFATFGLFCSGLGDFDMAYEHGLIDKVFTTNLVYRTPELLEREWYREVDLSKYISLIVQSLNHNASVSLLLDPTDKINGFLRQRGYKD